MVCLALQLQQAIKRCEVFVTRSHQYGDPRAIQAREVPLLDQEARLLQGAEWEAKRGDVCRALGLAREPKLEVERLSKSLHTAYHRVQRLDSDETIRLEDLDDILTPVVAPLDSLPESSSLKLLDLNVTSRLPEIDLSELLLLDPTAAPS
jgi:hypothetical protein